MSEESMFLFPSKNAISREATTFNSDSREQRLLSACGSATCAGANGAFDPHEGHAALTFGMGTVKAVATQSNNRVSSSLRGNACFTMMTKSVVPQ